MPTNHFQSYIEWNCCYREYDYCCGRDRDRDRDHHGHCRQSRGTEVVDLKGRIVRQPMQLFRLNNDTVAIENEGVFEWLARRPKYM